MSDSISIQNPSLPSVPSVKHIADFFATQGGMRVKVIKGLRILGGKFLVQLCHPNAILEGYCFRY